MKTLTAAVIALASLVAAAPAHAYPPSDPTVTVSNPRPMPGGRITVRYDGCKNGDTATFVLAGASAVATVSGGIASVELPVPATPGPYTGTVTCTSGGISDSFAITVQRPVVPDTGGNAFGPTSYAGAAVLLAGLGLLGASRARRRARAAS